MDDNDEMKIKPGTAWIPPKESAAAASGEADDDTAEPHIEQDHVSDTGSATNEVLEGKIHTEKPSFDGDRVLGNSELFLQDFGWWIEAAYSVPEGDVGRMYEILKVCCQIIYCGSNHQPNRLDLDFCVHWHFESKLLRLHARFLLPLQV